ncbi:hypothetical protein SAMN05444405_1109 [Bacteroides luti]|uniref:Uncharacterized protein n=1 Tax=Bacteroides luti TaxID=1297750 RepID=A0A1M5CDW8_9BACE|nr:hypothetical protein SAMN05444405_1109 [Bacteroides luti]
MGNSSILAEMGTRNSCRSYLLFCKNWMELFILYKTIHSSVQNNSFFCTEELIVLYRE